MLNFRFILKTAYCKLLMQKSHCNQNKSEFSLETTKILSLKLETVRFKTQKKAWIRYKSDKSESFPAICKEKSLNEATC